MSFVVGCCGNIQYGLFSVSSPTLQQQRGRAKDPVKFLQSIEQRARERQVAYETVKILRTRVIECYRREGVNHYENCKQPVEEYYNVIVKKDLGQLQPKWANPEKNDVWHGAVSADYSE